MIKKPDDTLALAKERTVLANERTKMSNERTFLSWVRTGLACVAGGIAIIRFLPFQQSMHEFIAKIVGECLIVMGILIFLIAFFNYRQSYKQLDLLPEQKGSFLATAFVTVALVVLSSILLWIT